MYVGLLSQENSIKRMKKNFSRSTVGLLAENKNWGLTKPPIRGIMLVQQRKGIDNHVESLEQR
jgi:hypothetical protein